MFPAGAVQRHRANIALSKYRILFFTQSCSGSPSLSKFPESEAFSNFPESSLQEQFEANQAMNVEVWHI